MEFRPMPKTPRFSREVVITEKIDGTNASVMVAHLCDVELLSEASHEMIVEVNGLGIWTGSRTRWITSEDDNYGFAAWVRDNADELVKLGPGHHFGEWWGRGIQRGYGLAERRFSLFSVGRWGDWRAAAEEPVGAFPRCCHVVPTLARGAHDSQLVELALNRLRDQGSFAAPGFMDPEGIMVYHTAANQLFKKTLKDDEEGKSAGAQPKKERVAKAPRDPSKGGRRVADLPFEGPDRRRPR